MAEEDTKYKYGQADKDALNVKSLWLGLAPELCHLDGDRLQLSLQLYLLLPHSTTHRLKIPEFLHLLLKAFSLLSQLL